MQLVNAYVEHPKLGLGFRTFLVLADDGRQAHLLDTARLVAANVPAWRLRHRCTSVELKPRQLRERMLATAEQRRRLGREISEKAMSDALTRLGAAESRINRTLETEKMPEKREKDAAKKVARVRNKEIHDAMVEAKQARAMVERARAEEEIETKAKAKAKAKNENAPVAGSKTRLLFDLMRRPGGAANKELVEAVGYPIRTPFIGRNLANKHGLDLIRTVEENGGTRYALVERGESPDVEA